MSTDCHQPLTEPEPCGQQPPGEGVTPGDALAGRGCPDQLSSPDQHPVGSDASPPAECTWHLTVSYDGTGLRGWQIQPDQRTVQGELQRRLRMVFRQPELRIVGTSRTDAGVHALDQHVSFVSPGLRDCDADGIWRTLNRWLPDDIRVGMLRQEAPGFSARMSNCGKAYIYCICPGEKADPLFSRYVWQRRGELDITAMQACGRLLEGEQDFASFGVNPRREIVSTVRHVHRIEVTPVGDLVCVTVIGESFLYKMVRSIVGYLVYVGAGKASAQDVERVLEARDRCAAADSAPAAGLFLAKVFFGQGDMRSYSPKLPPFAWMDSAPQ